MTAPAALPSRDVTADQVAQAKAILKEGNVEMVRRLQRANPLLKRPAVLRFASGRYTRDMPVERGGLPMLRLPLLRPANFDDFVTDVVRQDQLLIVLLCRGDSQEHVWAEQLMEYVHGALAVAACTSQGLRWPDETPHPDSMAYRMCKFEMAQSRFLVKRYNVKGLPAYLTFYGGQVVSAVPMGGRAIYPGPKDGSPPRTLLVEPTFKDQIATERILRRLHYKWELAMTAQEALAHVKQLKSVGQTQAPEYAMEYM